MHQTPINSTLRIHPRKVLDKYSNEVGLPLVLRNSRHRLDDIASNCLWRTHERVEQGDRNNAEQ